MRGRNMTTRRLGLDLGSNSIGWALLDESARILATGVRVFPEGVDRDKKGGELSKNETRRIARGMRRQVTRRAKRKRRFRRLLVDAGLLPPCAVLPAGSAERVEWERQAFYASDPYVLRRRALSRSLDSHELGRAFLHLCQRRGFLSNRKADRENKKEASKMLAEISQLESQIKASEAGTLGEHLAGLTSSNPLARLRGRHTRRDMYDHEFDAIWAAQQPYHQAALTEDLRQKLHHVLFHQRPIRVPKSVIGTCELEPNRRRCPRADRRAQRFRMLQEVNNLLLIDEHGEERPLSPEERTILLDYLAAADKRSFDDIRKILRFDQAVRFNLERGKRKNLLGMQTDKAMSHKSRFGAGWGTMDEERRNSIVRTILDEEEDTVLRLAETDWGLSAEQAQSVLEADLPAGYMAFSREAIARLLPHMERGLPLMADDGTPCAISEAGYLRPDQRHIEKRDKLPLPPDLPNPIVRQALHEVRKVVNAILREYGAIDQIHIELAREVKGSLEQRMEYLWRTREREDQRNKGADAIRQHGVAPTRETINRYLLWEEQGGECAYTGKPISLAQLLGGEVDVDHILPKPRSLDDSMMNKVVCFRSANAEKGNRTPYEWLAQTDPTRYEQICLRARKTFHGMYGKYKKFLLKELKLDDFIHRQLTDTAYISRAVRQYLQPLVPDPLKDILCTKGQLTAELRHDWGLNTILRDDGLNLKAREDHRHHAIDAIVIALTDRSRLQALARENVVLPPREHFRQEVEAAINAIHVSHRVQRKVAGALHDETVYARTGKDGEFACRKPLSTLTAAEVERIRDHAVRGKVIERLREFGIEPGRKKKGEDKKPIPAEVWARPLWMNEEKQILILKVRVTKPEKTIQPIRGGTAYVKPGNTHHLCIFELPGGKREAVFVTMIEAARRAARGEPLINRIHPSIPDARFIMSLSAGELVLADWKGQERLLQYNTAASTTGQIHLVDPLDARQSAKKEDFSFSANTLRARKVTIDTLGRIRWAND